VVERGFASDTTGYNHEQKPHPGGMPETDGASLASLRDAVIFILGSGGIGRVATRCRAPSTTGLYLASLRFALAISVNNHISRMNLSLRAPLRAVMHQACSDE
jgi:hypothetical protein